jgi:uncharacterized membrane protein YphA (DoxX/SURF4 family)
MLSLFPSLLFLAPLSALAIRVALAILFALAAYTRARNASSIFLYVLAALEFAAALSFALGYRAQAGAVLGAVLVGAWFVVPSYDDCSARTARGLPSLRAYPKSTALLMFILCLSILVTGPGAFAFDLPL